jgi:hypothetical protein
MEILGWSLVNMVQMLVVFTGEIGEAPALAREALASAERVGSPFSQVHSLRGVAMLQLFQKDFANAIASLERGLGLVRERHTALEVESDLLSILAQAHLGAGDRARAAALADEALAMTRERGSRSGEINALSALVRVRLAGGHAGEAAEIEALVDALTALVEDTGMRLHLPIAFELRARVAALRGDAEASERHLREAHRLYAGIGAKGHAARLARELES